MAVITINGQRGSGAREIGAKVARLLQYDYVDRLILSEAARHLGATVEAVEDKWQRSPGFGERLSRFLERLMERSATASAGGDPFPSLESHPEGKNVSQDRRSAVGQSPAWTSL